MTVEQEHPSGTIVSRTRRAKAPQPLTLNRPAFEPRPQPRPGFLVFLVASATAQAASPRVFYELQKSAIDRKSATDPRRSANNSCQISQLRVTVRALCSLGGTIRGNSMFSLWFVA
jgi:hypothetical protein